MIGLLMCGITVGLLYSFVTGLPDAEARYRATKASGVQLIFAARCRR